MNPDTTLNVTMGTLPCGCKTAVNTQSRRFAGYVWYCDTAKHLYLRLMHEQLFNTDAADPGTLAAQKALDDHRETAGTP